MMLPDYWLPRPAHNLGDTIRHEVAQLIAKISEEGQNGLIDYSLPIPKWQFLCHLADTYHLILHGTGNPHIDLFEPRQSNDLNSFGNQKAVYGAGDGLWAMFFAVVDRDRFAMSVSNACIRLVDKAGQRSEPFYVFSVTQAALVQQPWRTGVVYLLPPETFIPQPALSFGEYQVWIPQYASLVSVKPLARLEVGPLDFPFLSQIRGHDDERLAELSEAMAAGAPWPE